MIHALIDGLAASGASLVIQRTFWIVPVVQTLHLLALGVVLASGVLLGLRLLDWGWRSASIAETVQRFAPWVWGGLAVLLASGLVLIVGEPARTLGNPAFWVKISVLGLALALLLTLQRRLRRDAQAFDAPATGRPRAAARWIGASSLVAWVAVVVLGRWIAYVLEV